MNDNPFGINSFSMENPNDRWRFVSPHHLQFRTPDNKEVIMLSGVVVVDFKGQSGESWRRESVFLEIGLRDVRPPDKLLRLYEWCVFVGPNAMYNANISNNSGYAVDAFSLVRSVNGEPQLIGDEISSVMIQADLAARDSDAFLFRVGYQVTLKGEFVDPHPV
ncbi:MAG: hypothetical protein L6R45_11580 [Anaerolineae bacterium]|nr:hypothetical protein [Anaerolineae bacterium]